MLTEAELKAMADKLGVEAKSAIDKAMGAYEEKAKQFANEAAKAILDKEVISKETFDTFKKSADETLATIKGICEKQGLTINDLVEKVGSGHGVVKSIAETLKDDKEELRSIYKNRSGAKEYMLTMNEKGEFVMVPHEGTKADTDKAVGPVATIAGINGGTAASIFQSIDAASLLRLGSATASIYGQYRNNTWLFDLVNVVNAGWDNYMAMWFEEVARVGSPAVVAEGATKPLVQYGYTLRTATYKKEAMLISFTEEFSLDFARLQSDILGKGRIDVMNAINSALLVDITAAATAYNTGTQYKNGTALSTTNYNDYLTIDAAAAQVDNATFGGNANVAIMSTFKEHRVGTQMNSYGDFLMKPPALNDMRMIGNPAMGTDDLIVADLKQFNLILRGGLIVRVGYNGTDFAQNMFSTVIEQYFYDYISAIRAVSIVKGSTFSAIKTAITT